MRARQSCHSAESYPHSPVRRASRSQRMRTVVTPARLQRLLHWDHVYCRWLRDTSSILGCPYVFGSRNGFTTVPSTCIRHKREPFGYIKPAGPGPFSCFFFLKTYLL